MKKIVILTSVLLVSFILSAYNLRGKVTDADTGEELIGASVSAAPGRSTITDLYGNYTLECYHGEWITYSMMGYITQELPTGPSVINVALEPDAESLDGSFANPFESAFVPAWHQ